MRGIEFLAPVEAMRGNLSGKQKLVYPTKDNSAWEAPSGVRSYARNYATRYIGSKRAADGLKFFSVKQRSAVFNSPAQRQAQALMGASKLIVDFIMNNITWRITLLQMFQGYRQQGLQYQPAWSPDDMKSTADASVRHYLMRNLRELTLVPRNKQFTIQPQIGADIVVNNPWRLDQGSTGSKVTRIDDYFIKFWKQLGYVSQGDTPIYFYVGSVQCVAGSTTDFDIYINSTPTDYAYGMNTIGLTADSNDYVKLGTNFLQYNGEYVTMGNNIVADGKYYLTDIAPA